MKLEYLDASGNNAYVNISPVYLVCLSNFSDEDKRMLMRDIYDTLIVNKQPLQLDKLKYIHPINCSVSLQLSDEDQCMVPTGEKNAFACLLSIASFQKMIEIIRHVADGHNWLTPGEYLDEPAFLISRWGGW